MGSLVTQDLVDRLYEAVVRLHTNTTHTEEEEAEDRILDAGTLTNLVTNLDLAATFNTLSGLFSFITSNLDVVTALSLVKYLENRAMYDPRSGHMIVSIDVNMRFFAGSEKASRISWRTTGYCKTLELDKQLHSYFHLLLSIIRSSY